MAFEPHKVKSIRALHDHVIVSNMEFKERVTTSGIVLLSDNGRSAGIRARWGQVYAVGSKQERIKVGQWICVAHGRWTRGFDIEEESGTKHTIRRVDNDEILLISDVKPDDLTFSDAVDIQKREM